MLFQQLGQDLIFAGQLIFQRGELSLQSGGGLFGVVFENQLAALEKFLLPAVKLAGLNPVLITEIGDRFFLHQVGFKDGDFLFRR
jgi:hypothetical protein